MMTANANYAVQCLQFALNLDTYRIRVFVDIPLIVACWSCIFSYLQFDFRFSGVGLTPIFVKTIASENFDVAGSGVTLKLDTAVGYITRFPSIGR